MHIPPLTSPRLDETALGMLMPMHIVVGPRGNIRHVGPTLVRLRSREELIGRLFCDVFDIRRPRSVKNCKLSKIVGNRLYLQFREGTPTSLKGVLVALPDDEGFLVNLSFGIEVIEAVRDYDLTATDFAPTDLAVEMLYLVEAKSAAMEESRNLNLRLQRAKMAAEEQAFTDTLTGVRNRRALDQMLARMIASGSAFTLMHLDLDFFKEVNDTLGHAAGDHVLRSIARRLFNEMRSDDMIARLGGDEFVIALHAITDPDRVEDIARRIIRKVEEPVIYEGNLCSVSTSLGSTISLRYADPKADQMHKDADAALYASKRAGRGRHVIASEGMTLEAMPLERQVVGDVSRSSGDFSR